jgi:hypothetical protein
MTAFLIGICLYFQSTDPSFIELVESSLMSKSRKHFSSIENDDGTGDEARGMPREKVPLS